MNFHLLSLTEIPKKHEEIPNGHKEKTQCIIEGNFQWTRTWIRLYTMLSFHLKWVKNLILVIEGKNSSVLACIGMGYTCKY